MLPYQVTIAGLAELSQFSVANTDFVVSLLDPGLDARADMRTIHAVPRREFRFHDTLDPAAGALAPDRSIVGRLLALGEELDRTRPRRVLIHCHLGMSRSTATAAMLMAQAAPGREAEIPGTLLALRPQAWPNSRMIRDADDLLAAGGALVEAGEEVYRRAAMARPYQPHSQRDTGRSAEIPAGYQGRGRHLADA
ncbi:MAG: protein-tyrosine-phosphatase [Bauldia litoralis]